MGLGGVRLVDLWSLDCGGAPRVSGVAGVLGEVISSWSAPAIDAAGGSAGGRGRLVCWALRFLGARLAPVAAGGGGRVPLDALGVYDGAAEPAHGLVYRSTLELAAAPSPLVFLGELWGLRVWGKLEFYRPYTLSVKDRTVVGLLRGRRVPRGSVVAEASSGNTAVALAAARGPWGLGGVVVYLPVGASGWSRLALRLYGAGVVETGAATTPEAAGVAAREARGRGWVYLDQFSCDWNFATHLSTTAVELDYQLRVAGVKPSAFIVSTGTCGHGCAVSFFMRHRRPQARRVAAQPAPGEGIPGIRRAETGMAWRELAGFTDTVDVTLREALEAGLEAARASGVLPGPSGGAALAAARRLALEGGLEGDVVVVIPDTGYKYLDLYAALQEGAL